jgi:uncharacterized protein YeaO (DUF488 family)
VLRIKSIYDSRSGDDGYRILIEPEWPRGAPKGKDAGCDWMRSLGPSANLRDWMRRNPRKKNGFRDRYLAELGHNERDVARVCEHLKRSGTVTILVSDVDDAWGTAPTLVEYLGVSCA